MKIRFNGGPWDGVEFEAPFHPDAIHFRNLDIETDEETANHGTTIIQTAIRNHHQYLIGEPKLREGVEPKVGENMSRELEEGESLLDVMHSGFFATQYRICSKREIVLGEVMSQEYTFEKLRNASETLVSADGGIKARLESALLAVHTLSPNDFLEIEQKRFRLLWDKVDRVAPVTGEGSIRATLNAMTTTEAAGIAKELLRLYVSVASLTGSRSARVSVTRQIVLPLIATQMFCRKWRR